MSMHEYLAAAYGTASQTDNAQPDAEKIAQAELFAKLAADHGIDLNKLSDEEVTGMYQTFAAKLASTPAAQAAPAAAATKVAEFPPGFMKKKDEKPEDKKDEKKEEKEEHEKKEAAARAEFNAKREWTQKTAEADYLGRTMAHSFAAELRGIAATPAGTIKEASAFAAMIKEAGKKFAKKEEEKPEEKKEEKKDEHPFPFGKKDEKKASALDELAAHRALELAVGAGMKADEIGPKLAAVLVLGAPESTKLASVTDFDQAREVRALELLESIGIPVEWNKA